MEYYKWFEGQVDKVAAKYEIVNTISRQYNIPRPYLAVGVFTIVFLFVFVGLGASLFSQLIGFAYPAYASFKAIESVQKEDDTLWLTYWVVFAVFSLLETFSDTLLWWFPLYYTFKIAFLLWCQMPLTRGAEFMYKHFIRNVFLTYSNTIDQYLAQAATFGTNAAASARGAAAGVIADNLNRRSASGSSASAGAMEAGAGAAGGVVSPDEHDPRDIFGTAGGRPGKTD